MDNKEYIQALIRQNHPRHKEAMEIRRKRLEKKDKVFVSEFNGEIIRTKIN